ncbi:ferroptosis suppressor protein 1 isoform X3 [Lepidochelys kempii]|uniref:ferroptosis suppressor protein 1 isoform X3 n=1 Tax=Lepidochelys kempii TaxID=8472 RepID=UPI003C6FFE65
MRGHSLGFLPRPPRVCSGARRGEWRRPDAGASPALHGRAPAGGGPGRLRSSRSLKAEAGSPVETDTALWCWPAYSLCCKGLSVTPPPRRRPRGLEFGLTLNSVLAEQCLLQCTRQRRGRDGSQAEAALPSRMGSKLSVDDSVRVVIVGGGFGGIAAARQLKSWGIPFVLVDMRDAFHHNVGALRASVESGFAKKTFISYFVTFVESFRQAKVVGIDLLRQKVLLNDNEELFYSHLILATGSDGPFPGKFNQIIDMETAIQMYEDMVKELQKSPRIVIVGGGAAGVEMAAEIKTEYPAKEVTLIHSKIALADVELLPSVRQVVKEILLRKEVNLLLNPLLPPPFPFCLDSSRRIESTGGTVSLLSFCLAPQYPMTAGRSNYRRVLLSPCRPGMEHAQSRCIFREFS